MIGYHYLEGLSWIDSLLDAAMIPDGYGTYSRTHKRLCLKFCNHLRFVQWCGIFNVIGCFLAPVIHRFMHHFHFDDDNKLFIPFSKVHN